MFARNYNFNTDMDSHLNPGAVIPIFSQFDVRVNKNGKEQYFCHLSPCREKNLSFGDHHSWEIHRMALHQLLREILPGKWVVRKWIQAGKPVPYPWPVPAAAAAVDGPADSKPPEQAIAAVARAAKVAATSSHAGSSSSGTIDPASTKELLQPASLGSNIFFQFDVRDSTVDGKPPQFFCLLHPCFEKNHFLANRWNLAKHRKDVHKVPSEEKFPSLTTIGNWIMHGKPRPFDDPEINVSALAKPTSEEKAATSSRSSTEEEKKMKQAPASMVTKATPADQSKDLVLHFSELTVKRG